MNRPTISSAHHGYRRRTPALTLLVVLAGCPRGAGDHGGEHAGHADEHSPGQSTPGSVRHDEHAGEGLVVLDPAVARRIGIETSSVSRRAFAAVVSTTGQVGFDEDRLAHVAPRVAGRVTQVRANLGSRVAKGAALATIDSIALGRAKSAYLSARAELSLAKKTLERERGLRADKINSEQAVLEAESTHQRSLARYQSARQELRLLGVADKVIDVARYDDPTAAFFSLTAPIAGTIVQKHVNLGEVVSPNRNLYTIADLSRLWIWIDVFERDLTRVHLGDDVVVTVDAFPEKQFSGKVAYVRHEVDPDTRVVRARVDVPNADRLLRAGMFATVTVAETHGGPELGQGTSLVVPAGAVQRDGAEWVCFVVEGDNRYRRRVIRIGRKNQHSVEVLSGIEPGDVVATHGTFILKSEAAKERMGGGHSH